MATSTSTKTNKKPSRLSLIRALSKRLREWWTEEGSDWEALSQTGPEQLPGGEDLWNVPEVDSKAIARSSPVFEEILGMPLKAALIRPGGYQSIDEAIDDLIPKMVDKAIKDGSIQVAADASER